MSAQNPGGLNQPGAELNLLFQCGGELDEALSNLCGRPRRKTEHKRRLQLRLDAKMIALMV
jgi:hypothetical protein